MAINLHNGVDSSGVLDFAYEILALQENLDSK